MPLPRNEVVEVEAFKLELRRVLDRAQILRYYVQIEERRVELLKSKIARMERRRDRTWRHVGNGKYRRRPAGCDWL